MRFIEVKLAIENWLAGESCCSRQVSIHSVTTELDAENLSKKSHNNAQKRWSLRCLSHRKRKEFNACTFGSVMGSKLEWRKIN